VDAARWELTQQLFHEALALPRSQWPSFLAAQSPDDPGLIAEVQAMLEADAAGNSPLDAGLESFAALTLSTGAGVSPDQLIGPYRLVRILGEGGMGVVWLARRNDTDTLVAIKFLLHAGLSPSRRTRFAQEIRTLGRLRHPFIARFYDAGTLEGGTPWFVMEYVDGLTITDFCNRNQLGTEGRLQLFTRVCEAVGYAHSQEVIHRDLKPSNILVEADGTPRLLDFGIARELDSLATPSEQTGRGFRFLSPQYAAPEWVRSGTVGFVTDVYSLGVVLFELLAGHLPPQSSASDPISQPTAPAALPGQPSGSHALSGSRWAELDVLCTKALHPDSTQRYPSVEALLRDLGHFAQNEPLEARPDSFSYRAGKFFARHRTAILATAATLLLIAGLIGLFSFRLRRERDHAVLAEARSQRILHIMLDMLGKADTEAAPSNDLKVVTLLDRAALQVDTLHSDPRVQIELGETLGSMYDRLGNYDQSNRLFTNALAKARTVVPEQVVPLLIERSIASSDHGDLKLAEHDLDEAVRIAGTRHLPPSAPVMTQARLARGRLHILQGSYEQAIGDLAPPDSTAAQTTDPYDERDRLSYLADAQIEAQRFSDAEATTLRAIALDRSLLGETHPQTATDILNLASLRATQRRFPEAEQLYREGLASLRSWYGPDHPDVIMESGLLALTLVSQHRDAEAEPILRSTLLAETKIYGPVHERVALTLMSLGDIAVHQGKWSEAEHSYGQSLEIYRTIFGDGSARAAHAQVNLGRVYLEEGRPAAAEPLLRSAVAVLDKLPPGNTLIAVARARWGRSLLALGRDAEAEPQLLTADQLLKQQGNPPQKDVSNLAADLATLHHRRGVPAVAASNAPARSVFR